MNNKLGLPESVFDSMIKNYQNTMRELCKYGIMSIGEIDDLTKYTIAVPSHSDIDGKKYNADTTAMLAKEILSKWSNSCGVDEIHVFYTMTDSDWTDELSSKALEQFDSMVKENPYFPFGKEIFDESE